ncbi:questin oxidase-like protein [Chloropicon roscoffensis]|uniref:Questin oxidase-like protein n=1 Tax=Chloropicon roscoffensis TaxID=1461544 RepID=A0AAX4P8L9_9CHLO
MLRLGATAEQIEEQEKSAFEKNSRYGLLEVEEFDPAAEAPTAETWTRFINGDEENELLLRRFWRASIRERGRSESVGACLAELWPGLQSRLHHGPIRLAYASDDDEEETAAALAAYCCNYRPPAALAAGPASASCLGALEDLRLAFQEDMDIPKVIGGLGKKYAAYSSSSEFLRSLPTVASLSSDPNASRDLLDCCLRFYLRKPGILTLHLVTGMHALLVLREDFASHYGQALSAHYTSLACLFVSHKCPEIPKTPRPPRRKKGQTEYTAGRGWEELTEVGLASKSDHDIKMVDTCLELSKIYPEMEEELLLPAARLICK